MYLERIRNWFRFTLLYQGNPPWDTGVSPPELEAFIQSHAPGRALDLGCGTGTNLARLARAGWEVTGVDFVGKAVKAARRKLRQQGLRGTVIQGDATHIAPLTPPYDLVLDIGCYHGLPEALRSKYRRQLTVLLADSGTFLLYAHLKDNPESAMGVVDAELLAMNPALSLCSRTDGFDRIGRRSSWLTYCRKCEG